MQTANVVTDSSVATELIRVRGLTFTYPKSTEPAVRDMDLTSADGGHTDRRIAALTSANVG
jgi:hypothetical protein